MKGRTSKIRKSAKGQECQIRIPGFCNFDPDTTVLCHLGGAGWSLKANDIHAAYGCYECHLIVDGQHTTYHTKEQIKVWFFEAMVRTQLILLEKGLVEIT